MEKKKPIFRLEECDLKIIENKTKIYLKGWVHSNDYKIIVKLKNRNKKLYEIMGTESKYDVCLFFDEPVEDNKYGFESRETVYLKLKELDIYLSMNNKEKKVFRVRNNKIYNICQRIKKIFKMIYKAIRLFWREYHFLVPPSMLKKYFNDFKSRIKNIKSENSKCYNQDNIEEYHDWINRYEIEKKKVNISELKYINIDEFKFDELKNISEKYICFYKSNVLTYPSFSYYVNEEIKKDVDFIYTDSDLMIDSERQKPLFKPDWSRDTILGVNYIGNLFIVKTEIVKKHVKKTDKIDIYNYILKTSFNSNKISHISKVLYNELERKYDQDLSYKIVKEFVKDAEIIKNNDKETLTVEYKLKSNPLVSIIIPTKDAPNILETCLKSIYEKSTYKNFEIVIIDNNSISDATFKLFNKYKNEYDNFKVERLECPFNYSYINNEGAKRVASGEYLLFLNNDTEVITPNWLELMLGYAMQDHVGIVGAKLLFEDDTIQHAGLIIGKGGLAGHAHYGIERYAVTPQWELKIPYDVSGNTAACIMINKDKFLEVDGFEEKLAVAFNDVDLNLKIREKGYNNIYLPMVELFHYESKTRGLDSTLEKQKRFMSEWQFMMNKWGNKLKHDPYYNDNFSKEIDYKLDASKEAFKDE